MRGVQRLHVLYLLRRAPTGHRQSTLYSSLFCYTNHIRIAFEAVINKILEKLKQGCTVTNDILTYLGSRTTLIANTGYPDPEEHERTADVIEKEWPTFKEDKQLGHIPACVWSDRYEPHIFSDSTCMDDLKVKAIKYTKEYNKVLQHNQARVMHHHHKKDRSSGKRIPLPACRGKKSCLLYTSPSPRDATLSRMPSSA